MFWLLFFKVNVVSFNTEASTDGGSDITSCFSERLALAVPENKERLKKYIYGPKFIAERKLWVFFATIAIYHGKLPSLRSSRFRPVSLRPSAASRKDARGQKGAKKKTKDRRGLWGGGGGGADERKLFRFLPRPSLSGSFFLSRLFVLAPLGLKETETTSTQPTSSLKRPFNPYSGHLWEQFS